MTLTFQPPTYDRDYYAAAFNTHLRALAPCSPDAARTQLMQWTLELAVANVNGGYGGPFAALIVDFTGHIPVVAGVGCNHVIADHDPSAHAEMTALRDAAKRLGRHNLSGLSLITSCECCPMCLAAVTAVDIHDITFAANRRIAAQAGFSDEQQYRLIAAGISMHAQQATPVEHGQFEAHLQGHSAAVIITAEGQTQRFHGNDERLLVGDPTALASVQAIRHACKALQRFHLPEQTQLITRDKPHPMALIAADWARIGRRRSTSAPNNPAMDELHKDTSRMVYLNDDFERMNLHGTEGWSTEAVLAEVTRPLAMRRIKASRITCDLTPAMTAPFEHWETMLARGTPRY